MKRFLIPVGMYLAPLAVLAQASDLTGFANEIIDVINGVLVPLLLALAFLWFIWGVFRYFIASTDDAKEKGRDTMIFGLIGFFVIVSVWGLVNILVNTFGLDVGPQFELPEAERAN